MEKSPSSDGTTVIFTCAGASNVGQIADQSAIALQQEGFGHMSGLAGIHARAEKKRAEVGNVERIVGIDGCSNACTKKALEKSGIALTDHVVVTDLGVQKKTHDDVLDSTAVTRVKNAVKARLETVPGGPFCS